MDLQIKTKYHYTPIRIAKIQNTDTTKCWQGWVATGILIHSWWKCKMVQPSWKTFWQVFTKLNIVLPYDPAIALLGIYPNELKSHVYTKNLHTNVYSSFIPLVQTSEIYFLICWIQARKMYSYYIRAIFFFPKLLKPRHFTAEICHSTNSGPINSMSTLSLNLGKILKVTVCFKL